MYKINLNLIILLFLLSSGFAVFKSQRFSNKFFFIQVGDNTYNAYPYKVPDSQILNQHKYMVAVEYDACLKMHPEETRVTIKARHNSYRTSTQIHNRDIYASPPYCFLFISKIALDTLDLRPNRTFDEFHVLRLLSWASFKKQKELEFALSKGTVIGQNQAKLYE